MSKKIFLELLLIFLLMACRGEQQQDLQKKDPVVASIPVTQHLNIPDRDPLFTAVTDSYGLLQVTEGEFEAIAPVKPWSAYWLPVHNHYLFNGPNSPLAKYDAYVRATHSSSSSAAQYEHDFIYDSQGPGWEGSCDAWARASLLEKEPTSAIDRAGIHFTVGDLKALLVKTYERVDAPRVFGQRFDGNQESVYEDLYPDQFHKFIRTELFEKQRPFIMDKDPGIEIWNIPVWRVWMRVTHDPEHDHVMHVMTVLWASDPDYWGRDLDRLGTREVNFIYNYDLIGNLNKNQRTFDVLFGVWTKTEWVDSVRDHPDFVTPIPDHPVRRSSRNKNIDPKMVDEILSR